MKIDEFNNAIKSKITGAYELKEDSDSYGNSNAWVILENKRDVEVVAKAIKAYKGRCVAATAYKNEKENTHTVVYHFDINGTIVNMQLVTDNQSVHSITPILKSADWAEREMREMYDIEVLGHPCSDRLFLDYSLVKGVLNEYISLSKMQTGLSDTDVLWSKINKGAES